MIRDPHVLAGMARWWACYLGAVAVTAAALGRRRRERAMRWLERHVLGGE